LVTNIAFSMFRIFTGLPSPERSEWRASCERLEGVDARGAHRVVTMYNVGRWANDLGIDAVVSKPDGIGRLAECVRSLLATSRQFVVKYRTAIFDLQPDVMSWL